MESKKNTYRALLINGSPHEKGSTFTALNEVRKSLEAEGVECEIIWVGKETVRGCVACYGCTKLGRCAFDDIVNEIAKKFEDADALIVGSPVYYAAPNGTLISILDRLFYSSRFEKRMKVGAAVVSARRSGTTAAYDVLNKYFTISGMPIVPSTYWNNIHGNSAEDAEGDLEGLQTMRALGKNAAFLMKSIRSGLDTYGMPEREKKIKTNFIR